MTTTGTRAGRIASVFLTALAASGCSDLLDVTNPGPIEDDDLNAPGAMPALVTGMAGDLAVALSITTIWGSVWSDDLLHSGTLGAPTVFAQGDIDATQVNPWWNDAHTARWVAEDGIRRMQEVLGDGFTTSALAPRAYLIAGFANRILGESVCQAVIDGGAPTPFTDHFIRAEGQFTEALGLAGAQGEAELVTVAHAGRAQVRAALGDWEGAAADAALVPSDFRHDAVYSTNTERETNGWPEDTLTRGEYTVWGTPWYEIPDDPRIPWEEVLTGTGALATAANGSTPWVRQQKHLTDADEIALAKGTEMLLIRAEAALRAGDPGTAMDLMNDVRTSHGLGTLSAADEAAAWPILQAERGKTLWLEGRRFWDLRRWYDEEGPAHHGFLEGRDRCVPISDSERLSNPNVS